MRVLHLIDSLATGGKERQFLELLKGLASEPDIVCHAVVMSEAIDYEDFWRLEIGKTILPRRARYDVSMFPRLYAVMRSFRPDIVQSWNSMCSIYGAPLARLTGARFVDGFVRAGAPRFTMKDPDYFRSRFTLPLTDVVVGNSRAGLEAYSIPGRKAVCIHNGFDPERIRQLDDPGAVKNAFGIETPHIVGMVASFSHYKDYDTFFTMARSLSARRDDVTFVALGGGPRLDDYQARFPRDRFPAIRLLGRCRNAESIINTFTAGILTSTEGEGTSNAIMEYMALGKPVVATDCGGNAELIVEGETGYLIGNADEAALRDRVERILENDALARRMGEAGTRRIEQSFGLNRMTKAYVTLYRDLLGARREGKE